MFQDTPRELKKCERVSDGLTDRGYNKQFFIGIQTYVLIRIEFKIALKFFRFLTLYVFICLISLKLLLILIVVNTPLTALKTHYIRQSSWSLISSQVPIPDNSIKLKCSSTVLIVWWQDNHKPNQLLNFLILHLHAADYKYKKDEIFKRMKVTTLVQLVSKITNS